MIPVLPGDGIGPVVTEQAVRVLHALDHATTELPFGYRHWLDTGNALPDETLDAVREAGVALVGAATTPATGCDSPILALRRALGLDLLVRPTTHCTVVGHAFEGLYAEPDQGEGPVIHRRVLTPVGIDRMVAEAFHRATDRVTLVDKPTVFKRAAALLSATAERHSRAGIRWELVNADAFVARFVRDPHGWDVIAGTSFVSDLISDLAAAMDHGVGGAPSASLGVEFAVFEPVHGSAPRRAYDEPPTVDPTGSILAAAMLLDHIGSDRQAEAIRAAVHTVRSDRPHRTSEVGDAVLAQL